MSSKIKVDTIENVAGSGNVSLGSGHNLVVPGNVTGQGTLAITGNATASTIALGGRSFFAGNAGIGVNFSSASASGLHINDTNQGNLGAMLQCYSGSGTGTLIGNIQNANNTGVHMCVGTNGSVVFDTVGYTAANALDDYEEGTWAAQLTDGSTTVGTTVHQAFYTKIGNVVHCEFNIQRNDSATNNNNMEMTGLPFPHRTIPSTVGQAWIDNTSGDHKCFIYLPSDSSKIYFVKAGANDSYVNMNEYDNGRYVYAAFTYMTDS